MKYPNITLGRVEAVWNKHGGEEGVDKFLRDGLSVSKPTRLWREKDGVIYFSITSDGTTGEKWIKRLKSRGFGVGDFAQSVLRSEDFKPTNGVSMEIAVLKGSILFKDNNDWTNKIHAEADKHKLEKPNAEVACLIREKFTDKEIESMGISWIVVMHEPIYDSEGDLSLLRVGRFVNGRRLCACDVRPDGRWGRDGGHAFVVSHNRCVDGHVV